MALALIDIAIMLLWTVSLVIIVQAILSWLVVFNVINVHNQFMRTFLYTLDRLTAPLYRPIRKILPDFGGLDFSPLVVLLILWVLQRLLAGVAVDIIASGG